MPECKVTPVISAIFDLTDSQNDAEHLALLGSQDGFSQLVKRLWRKGCSTSKRRNVGENLYPIDLASKNKYHKVVERFSRLRKRSS